MTTENFSEKWQKRFALFEKYGAPNSPEHKAAMRSLPWQKRFLYNMNFFAFFFGCVYFLILGMWKRCLVLVVVSFAIGLVCSVIESVTSLKLTVFAGIVTSILWSMTANYAYYLHKVKGQNSWNPFTGIF